MEGFGSPPTATARVGETSLMEGFGSRPRATARVGEILVVGPPLPYPTHPTLCSAPAGPGHRRVPVRAQGPQRVDIRRCAHPGRVAMCDGQRRRRRNHVGRQDGRDAQPFGGPLRRDPFGCAHIPRGLHGARVGGAVWGGV
eukprot:364613-Chlamydomonas_euryale.AAC.12